MALLEFRQEGIYCPQADVYIDPWRRVDKALITHGHADHSRWGHNAYLCTHTAKPVIRYRLGNQMKISSVDFLEKVKINGVEFSFHPAGHILGSAQIRVEYKGEIWAASGDYKIENDGLAEAFEPVKCHTFITESTFGLPVYSWEPQKDVFAAINQWWRQNQAEGKTTVLTGYSLGKAQRLLCGLDLEIGTIYTHGAVENINQVIRAQGVHLPPTQLITDTTTKQELQGNIVIAPPSALGNPWMKRLGSYSDGIASGWMAIRGARRRRSADRGFVLSDHVDWDGLNKTIEATGAERVYVTHGYSNIFARWLSEKGLEAYEVSTRFEGELQEVGESNIVEEES